MKKYFKFSPFLLLGLCFVLNSCSEDEIETNQIQFSTKNNLENLNYLTDAEASIIAADLLDNLESHTNAVTGPNPDLANELISFWNTNENILIQTTTYTDLEDYELYDEAIYSDYSISIENINDAEYLTEKQKQYSTTLLEYAENKSFEDLIALKEIYYNEVSDYPELQIYSLIFALIDQAEPILFQKSDDCRDQALQSAIFDGAIGMVTGVISGGLGGFAVGGFLSFGVLAIPAGGAGAVVGAVAGGLLGFGEGYLRGYLSCKFWS